MEGLRTVLMFMVCVCVFSSDDDIDVILHGTTKQQERLMKRTLKEESSSEDEFEKEMASELNAKMKTIEKHWSTGLFVYTW